MFNKVNLYYRNNLSSLPFGKQFHFGSRLWLWSGDKEMGNYLRSVRAEFCADGNMTKFDDILTNIINTPIQEFGSKNAATERAPYFDAYPLLRPSLLVMFRMLFTETIYGFDARELIGKHFDINELDSLHHALLTDKDALSVLSTHAINFLYLYSRFYKKSEDAIPVEYLLELADSFDTRDNTSLLLYIYFVTHCVIGESLFYKRRIPNEKHDLYMSATKKLEERIEERYDDVNMDNKFEMLVCFRILGTESRLTERIYREAGESLSDQGDYIIDRHNNNPQTENIDFEKSEHRNVLFLLSNSEFHPTDTTI